jgi:hypothetical protein
MGKKYRMVAITDQGLRMGEDHPNAKLTNEQIDRIRDLHEDHDLNYRQLAEMFGVSKGMIAGVCQYRRRALTPFGWKKLEFEDEEDRAKQ